jgi:hypothetical protein
MKKIKFKHLRGRHNQLDHAWNRGTGQGGGGVALTNNQMGPVPNKQMYRQQAAALENQVRQGKITRAQSRAQLAQLRGMISPENISAPAQEITFGNRRRIDPSRIDGPKWLINMLNKILVDIPSSTEDKLEQFEALKKEFIQDMRDRPFLAGTRDSLYMADPDYRDEFGNMPRELRESIWSTYQNSEDVFDVLREEIARQLEQKQEQRKRNQQETQKRNTQIIQNSANNFIQSLTAISSDKTMTNDAISAVIRSVIGNKDLMRWMNGMQQIANGSLEVSDSALIKEMQEQFQQINFALSTLSTWQRGVIAMGFTRKGGVFFPGQPNNNPILSSNNPINKKILNDELQKIKKQQKIVNQSEEVITKIQQELDDLIGAEFKYSISKNQLIQKRNALMKQLKVAEENLAAHEIQLQKMHGQYIYYAMNHLLSNSNNLNKFINELKKFYEDNAGMNNINYNSNNLNNNSRYIVSMLNHFVNIM